MMTWKIFDSIRYNLSIRCGILDLFDSYGCHLVLATCARHGHLKFIGRRRDSDDNDGDAPEHLFDLS